MELALNEALNESCRKNLSVSSSGSGKKEGGGEWVRETFLPNFSFLSVCFLSTISSLVLNYTNKFVEFMNYAIFSWSLNVLFNEFFNSKLKFSF